MATHVGIRLRITTPWGDLLASDSDDLYWKAQYITGFLPDGPGNPLLTSEEDRWLELFPGDGQAFNGSLRYVRVLVRPVLLADVDDLDEPSPFDGYPFAGGWPILPPWRPRWPWRWRPRWPRFLADYVRGTQHEHRDAGPEAEPE